MYLSHNDALLLLLHKQHLCTMLSTNLNLCIRTIHMYSGITSGRVLDREFYTQRFYKLICLRLPTDCFMKISLQKCSIDWREIFMKQSVDKRKQTNF